LARAEAIQFAVFQAKVGDMVLLAGKGHENYQEIGGIREHFDDVEWAEAALTALKNRNGQ
jgi:UDP-N-acetylmuramyl tripeptide synthase